MAYNTKKNGSNIEVYRDEEHIANYDPVSEETTFTKPDHEKYSKHVGRSINELLGGGEPAAPAAPILPAELLPEEAPEVTIKRLKSVVLNLRAENAILIDTVRKLQTKDNPELNRMPERFSDSFDDSKAPAKLPTLGDMTPEYVEWARENMPKEIFEKRYKNRLK